MLVLVYSKVIQLYTCMHVVESLQLCYSLKPMECNLPGSSVLGILQAGILERSAILFSMASSRCRDRSSISYVSIIKQRHYFADKGLTSQRYGFSSSHVWMWELDYKESWAPKNWFFWTMVLEKTLESPLDCKKIKPINPQGNQSWIFITRTTAEAETPILWPSHARNWLIWKDPDAGKDWRQEKGMTEYEMVRWHHWLHGHEFEQAPGVGDGQESLACCSPWVHKVSDKTERLNWSPLHSLPLVLPGKPHKHVHIFFFIFFPITVYYNILNIVSYDIHCCLSILNIVACIC